MDERALRFITDTLKDKYSYNFNWTGRPVIQLPQDLMAIQELIWRLRPDFVIETGIAHGGGLVFYASVLEAIGHGTVIGIDIEIRKHNREALEIHPLRKRIRLLEHSSIDPDVHQILEAVKGDKVLVILDSDHTHKHVYEELRLYSRLVPVGSYLIVMDTIIEFLPKDSFPDRPWDIGDNPWTATKEFLMRNNNFEIDKDIDRRILLSSAPEGYLVRTK